jgi:hypothetical protein
VTLTPAETVKSGLRKRTASQAAHISGKSCKTASLDACVRLFYADLSAFHDHFLFRSHCNFHLSSYCQEVEEAHRLNHSALGHVLCPHTKTVFPAGILYNVFRLHSLFRLRLPISLLDFPALMIGQIHLFLSLLVR